MLVVPYSKPALAELHSLDLLTLTPRVLCHVHPGHWNVSLCTDDVLDAHPGESDRSQNGHDGAWHTGSSGRVKFADLH